MPYARSALIFWPACISAVLVLLSACTSNVMETTLDDTCTDRSVGAYYLPIGKLTVSVNTTTIAAANDQEFHRYSLEIQKDGEDGKEGDPKIYYAADNDELHCLTYLASPFAEDQIGVEHVPETSLLKRVFSKATDKSKDIAIALIDAVGEAVAARGRSASLRVGKADAAVVAKYTINPLNEGEMEIVNQALKHYGFCMYFLDHNDPFIPAWSPRQCDMPAHYQNREAGTAPSKTAERGGILYRPLLEHKLVVLQQPDPNSGLRWRVDQVLSVQLPNAAPTFAVDIKRSMFVERKTDIQFDYGILSDITVKKDSELNAAMDIPLRLAQVVAATPTRAIAIELNRVQNKDALIAANQSLIAQMRQNQELTRGSQQAPAGQTGQPLPDPNQLSAQQPTAAPRSGRVAACVKSGVIPTPDAEMICRDIIASGE